MKRRRRKRKMKRQIQADYSYQESLIERCFQSIISGNRTVLAAAPGAGKTRMALRIVDRYLKRSPHARVLILTHGQVILRTQWSDMLKRFHPDLDHHVLESATEVRAALEKSVILGIPQTIQYVEEQFEVDLLVIDEAHHYYHGEMISDFIERNQPKNRLLLTGTPSLYVGRPEYRIYGVTAQELVDYNVITDPLIELAEAKYLLTMGDYNNQYELKQGARFSNSSTSETLDLLLGRLQSKYRDDPTKHQWSKPDGQWGDLLKNLHKTMIVCHSQNQARDVSAYFTNRSISHELSISDLGKDSDAITRFKENKDCPLLIVVNRGILGFDYDDLMNLIDLSGSLNVNKLFQMLCRVVRRSETYRGHRKLFIKITPPELAHITHFVMSFVVALSDKQYYYSFSTKYQSSTNIPVSDDFIRSISDKERLKKMPNLPTLETFTSFRAFKNSSSIQTIAYTNLKEVLRRLRSDTTFSEAYAREQLSKYPSYKEFRKNNKSLYDWMTKMNLLSISYDYFPKKGEYKLEEVIELAKQYPTKSAFREAHHGAFKFLKKTGNLKKLKFQKKFGRWTVDSAIAECRKYKSKSQFQRMAGGCYEFLIRNGLRDLINSELGDKTNQPARLMDIEAALEIARQYKNRRQFRSNRPKVFSYIIESGNFDRLEEVLPSNRRDL
jgi:superfamily II DNA or RNA helicase